MSQLTLGCFQMKLVGSVNAMKKVWEIKKVDEMICHFTSTQKIININIACPALANLRKRSIGAGVDRQ
jgi:hypothetical protein